MGIAKSDDPIKHEINQIFKELCYKLDALTNFNFTPRTSESMVIQPKDGIVFKEHTLSISANRNREKVSFLAEKEIKKHSAHLKQKRQIRQRKKERLRKAENRMIEHDGMTKHALEVKKKIKKN